MRANRPTRREFLRTTLVGAVTASTWLAWPRWGRAVLPPPKVVDVASEAVQREHLVDGAILRQMVEEGIQALVNARTPQAAWKHLIAPNDVVGIKVSASVPNLSTHHLLIDEVVRGLLTADVPPENILIWDRFTDDLVRFGYAPRPWPDFGFPMPVGRVLGSEGNDPSIRRVGYDENAFFESEDDLPTRRDENGTISYFSYIVTQLATKLISLPVLQYSPITGVYGTLAGLAFGSLNNTFRFHPKSKEGMPVIADIWRESVLPEKHVLTIVDGLTGAYNTGPGYDPKWFWNANRLFVTQDPVAADTFMRKAINEQRKAPLSAVTDRETQYLRRAASYSLGTMAEKQIEKVERTIE